MKKIILCVVLLMMSAPAWADVLLSPEEQAEVNAERARRQKEYDEKRSKCPKDKPLYFDEKCYSCDDETKFVIHGHGGYMLEKCSEICPNRVVNTTWQQGPFWVKNCSISPKYARKAKEEKERAKLKACGCPKSHPLYGEKADKTGRMVGRCYSCASPEEFPFLKETDVCSDLRYVELPMDPHSSQIAKSKLYKNVTPNTSTVPCQNSKKSKTGNNPLIPKHGNGCDPTNPIYRTYKDKYTGKKRHKCYPCSWKGPIEFEIYDEAINCQKHCPKRSLLSRDGQKWQCK